MGKISINYDCLSSAASNLRSGASTCRHYSSTNLNTRCQNKLSSIEGGLSGSVCAAYDEVSEKQRKLNQKADRLDALAAAIDNLHQHAQNADDSVSTYVTTKASAFQTANGMECGLIEGFWNWICDGVSSILDSTGIGQWLADVFRHVGDFFSDFWRGRKQWYIYDGGKFWIGIASGLVAIGLAIITIVTGGVGLLAIIAAVGAVIAIVNAGVKIYTNIQALRQLKDDPYRADHTASIQKLSDLMRDKAHGSESESLWNTIANIIDGVDNFCAVVGLIDSGTKLYESFTGKTTMFQKYLGQRGYVDSMFMQDTKSTHFFDEKQMKWFLKDESGHVTTKEVDFSKVDKSDGFRFDIKTGIDRMKSTVILPSRAGSDTIRTATGYEIFKNRFVSDLKKVNPGHDSKNFVNNLKKTSVKAFDRFKGLNVKYNRHQAAKQIKKTVKDWTKINDINAFFRKDANKIQPRDVANVIKNIYNLPKNTYKVITLDWAGFTKTGDFISNLDKQTGSHLDSALKNIKQKIWNLGRPAPQPATP